LDNLSTRISASAGFFLSIAFISSLTHDVNSAQNTNQKTPHRVPKVNGRVHIDGVIDDEIWRQALILELTVEVDPGENIEAPVQTDVYLAYDDHNLYVAFDAHDPDPAAIRANLADRDRCHGDDMVGIILDTFNDQRRSYDFISNPLGVQLDQTESADGGEDESWDAIWNSVGRITSDGFTVEMGIPFSSLRFQRRDGDQTWGVDVIRVYPRSVMHQIGLFPRDRNNDCYWCQMEKLIGFEGATPGKDLELDLTTSALMTQEREGYAAGSFIERDKEFNPGLTARWGFRPNATLSVTVNPDFSQVEADAAQLDINTQFALYYSEKRPFFLEGKDFFQTSLNAVYTRTIAEPDWGVKLTGKEGSNTFGLFTAGDNITNLLFPFSQTTLLTSVRSHNVGSVFRYSRDIRGSSNLGLLVTDREGDNYNNRLAGVDGTIRFTRTDRVQFQLLGSSTEYPDEISTEFGQIRGAFRGLAADFSYLHNARNLDWYAFYTQVDADFRADLGFIPQANYRRILTGVDYSWYNDPDHWYNTMLLGTYFELEEDLDGNKLCDDIKPWFSYYGPVQTYLYSEYSYKPTRYYNGVEFEDHSSVWGEGGIRPSNTFFLYIQAGGGDAIDYANTRSGTQLFLKPELDLKFGRHLSLELSHTFEYFTIDNDRLYSANVSYVKTIYQFTRRAFVRAILQYLDYDYNPGLYTFAIGDQEQFMFNQLLFSYKINPQTVFFLGYSDNFFGDQDIRLTQTDRTVFVKIGYAWVI